MSADGHFWLDDLKSMAWMGVRDQLRASGTALWVIAGKAEDLKPETKYGLTLLVLSIRTERPDISVLWVDTGDRMSPELLPSILAGVPLVRVDSAMLGAKLAASANMPMKSSPSEYRLEIHANPASVSGLKSARWRHRNGPGRCLP